MRSVFVCMKHPGTSFPGCLFIKSGIWSGIFQKQKPQVVDNNYLWFFRVPGAGVEPAQPCGHWCLRPARLPIPPSGQLLVNGAIGKRGNKCSYFFLVMKPECFFDFRMKRIGYRTGLGGSFNDPSFTVAVCAPVREVHVYNNFSYPAG